MYFQFLPTTQVYDGAQLRSHFIFERTGYAGDAIVAFTGEASVTAAHMVDQEDIAAQAWIYSPNMLHFIVEHFDMPLAQGVAQQRLLIAALQDTLKIMSPESDITRIGDDLFQGEYKLSVSIATRSPISTCIHTGINIESKGTPVPTRGLADYAISAMPFALRAMHRYVYECRDMAYATRKVKAVP